MLCLTSYNILLSLEYVIHIHEMLCWTSYNILSSLKYIIHIHEILCLTSYNILSSLKYIIHIHEMPCLTSYNIVSSLKYIIHYTYSWDDLFDFIQYFVITRIYHTYSWDALFDFLQYFVFTRIYHTYSWGDLSLFWLSCLGLLVLVLPKLLNYLAFQSFDFERTWWRLFQKDVVRTKFDIYVFIPYSYMQS